MNNNTKSTYALEPDGSFVIENYNHASAFSNFLPGIAGEWGIPLWVFYVNRGQAIAGFGLKDKDHSIAEFFPANKAYAFTPGVGFRTFLKSGGEFYEPFRVHPNAARQAMSIRSESVEIAETSEAFGLATQVRYFTLANMPLGALARVVTIKNTSPKTRTFEMLDGMSRIIPFGSGNWFLKEMTRTLEAWMRVFIEDGVALFRLTVDPRDVAHTRFIEGANFNYSFTEQNGKKTLGRYIADPAVLFGHDTSFERPDAFIDAAYDPAAPQILCGKTPCAFSHFSFTLESGQERSFYNIFGASFSAHIIKEQIAGLTAQSLRSKEQANKQLIERLKGNAFVSSAMPAFDQYVQQTYLDNVLRGGYPLVAASSHRTVAGHRSNAYYIFSRKHGDLERDYNNFQLTPSYFSEGEANYRDINQNRRMDLFFQPSLSSSNITYFLNFIKMDGYNPLIVRGEKLRLPNHSASALLSEFGISNPKLTHLAQRGFYLGEFFSLLESEGIAASDKAELLSALIGRSQRLAQATHQEGYWIDHWRYNLDLFESFLYFYPDRLKELFTGTRFVFWDDEYRIRPRANRYHLRQGNVYQGEGVEISKEKKQLLKDRNEPKNYLRTKKGKIYETTLVEKLLVIILF